MTLKLYMRIPLVHTGADRFYENDIPFEPKVERAASQRVQEHVADRAVPSVAR